jgi:hypothetical protein
VKQLKIKLRDGEVLEFGFANGLDMRALQESMASKTGDEFIYLLEAGNSTGLAVRIGEISYMTVDEEESE